MRNLSVLIALLLIVAIIFLPVKVPNKTVTVSPLAVNGDTADITPQAENGSDAVRIIATVIIIVFIIYLIANTEQNHSKEVKAGWK